jgi:predicted secreted protein
MAITSARGTILALGNAASPTTSATIAEIKSFDISTKGELVDITTHSTPGLFRKKLGVIIDPGEVTTSINFDAANATHAFTTGLWSLLITLARRGYTVTFPNASGVLTYVAYVLNHGFTAPVDNVLGVNLSFGIEGAIAAA